MVLCLVGALASVFKTVHVSTLSASAFCFSIDPISPHTEDGTKQGSRVTERKEILVP